MLNYILNAPQILDTSFHRPIIKFLATVKQNDYSGAVSNNGSGVFV